MQIEREKELSIRTIFGIPIFIGSKQELLEKMTHQVDKGKGLAVVFTPNPEQIALSFHDQEFGSALGQATWNLPDGQGLVWALNRKLRMESGKLRVKRLAGREVFHDLLTMALENHWSVFLLGGRPGAAETIAKVRGQGTDISSDKGARDIKQETLEEENRVLEKINNEKPQILFVAYGAPWQERWILKHRGVLEKSGVKIAMVVGGAFDYEAGFVKPVPAWTEKAHLEWLWRLISEPWRWRRQLKGLEFFWRVIFT